MVSGKMHCETREANTVGEARLEDAMSAQPDHSSAPVLVMHLKPCHWPVYRYCLCGPSDPDRLAIGVHIVQACLPNNYGQVVDVATNPVIGGRRGETATLYQVAWAAGTTTWHSSIDLRVAPDDAEMETATE